MRRWIGLLLRLYPPAWRARYGDGFNALLDEAPLRGADFVNVVQEAISMRMSSWTTKQVLLSSTLGGVLIAAATAVWLPNWYVATAVFQIPAGSVGTVPADVRNAISRTSLAGLIERHGLYPEQRRRLPVNEVVNRMRGDIRLDAPTSSRQGSRAVELQFTYPDPARAQAVVRELSSSLQAGAQFSLLDPATSHVVGANRRVIVFLGLFSGLLLGGVVRLIRNGARRVSAA